MYELTVKTHFDAAHSLAGYPGVICMTPLAWLLALPTGVRCVLNSRSDGTRVLLREAALAGVGLGLIEVPAALAKSQFTKVQCVIIEAVEQVSDNGTRQ